jgi:hypothetical protein
VAARRSASEVVPDRFCTLRSGTSQAHFVDGELLIAVAIAIFAKSRNS